MEIWVMRPGVDQPNPSRVEKEKTREEERR